jgi:hypothetical protein
LKIKKTLNLKKISESIINAEKYIQHIVYEDGITFDDYIFPGVELVRSSTPLFAREKIVVLLSIYSYILIHSILKIY